MTQSSEVLSTRSAALTTACLLLVGLGAGPAQAQAPARGEAAPQAEAQAQAAAKPARALTWKKWGDIKADAAAKDQATGKYKPNKDFGSLRTITAAIGAQSAWKATDASGRAITGAGVTVAVLDTGIDATVAGLDGKGKVISGPDLSFEANSPDLAGGDNFGHGTHMAAIIAGRDPVKADRSGEPKAKKTDLLGVAPDATLLAVKVGTRDGSTDVSQVIAGLDWIVQHRNDNGMDVRVVNLSYGTDSSQSYLTDPLAAAAENAWRHGIVVVVSGGNDGSKATRLNNPAIDPYVIAVGASDPRGTVKGWSAPAVASFSSRGTPSRHVDLVAPGRSVASVRIPGSFVDASHPEGRVAGDRSNRLFRGSGTSQAAAVVSGAAALLLQARPGLTPDQVKAALTRSADPIAGAAAVDQGAGELDVDGALRLARILARQSADGTRQTWPAATGAGSLELSRGSTHLTDPDTGAVLSGEVDVQGRPWNPAAWHTAAQDGAAWNGGHWNGARWTGNAWTSDGWSAARWSGTRWSGRSWLDTDWDAVRWSGARWTGARWDGRSWL